MKHKFLKVLPMFVAAACLCFGIAACGSSGGGETYVGSVSEKTYTSVEEAVKGFLKEEVDGSAAQTEYVGYEKVGDLTQKEIDGLALGTYAEGLVSAEKGQVEYREEQAEGGIGQTAAADATVKREVYVLTYSDAFRFFAPPVKTGETLTAKYYASVFQTDKYSNCTVNDVWTFTTDGNSQERTEIVKIAETALGIETYRSDELIAVIYAVKKGETIHQWASEQDSVDTLAYLGISQGNIADTAAVVFQVHMGGFGFDHTYFEKTETGFAMRADKYDAFKGAIEEMMVMGDGYGGGIYFFGEEDRMLGYEFDVKDGKIVKAQLKTTYSVYDIEFSHFGTTEVTLPDTIKTRLEELS